MKMHYTISPIGFALNARGVSRGTGSVLSTASSTHSQVSARLTGTPVTGSISPQPFGRSRRF